MYFINCFIYTINKILKFKVVLLSLSGSDCSVVVIENVLLSTSRIPCAHFGHLIYFPRFFTRESVVRVGRRESKCLHLLHREEESALEEALRVSISLLMLLLFSLLISLPWFYIMLSLIQFLRRKNVDLFCTRVHRNYFDRCQPLGTLLVNMWINLITFSSGMNTWKKRNSLTLVDHASGKDERNMQPFLHIYAELRWINVLRFCQLIFLSHYSAHAGVNSHFFLAKFY